MEEQGEGLAGLAQWAAEKEANLKQPNQSEQIHFIAIPDGTKLTSLENYQFPEGRQKERIDQRVSLTDRESFVRYVSLFGDERTRVFASPARHTFTSFLDYHVAGDRKAEFLRHRADWALQMDDRWTTWAGKDGATFTQEAFAEFIEENYDDIDTPPAAEMLEVARDLKATMDVAFESKVSSKDGRVQMRYVENITMKGGDIEIPDRFTIRIPVFYGEEPIVLDVRLRYRLQQQRLSFFYRIHRKQEVLQTAFDGAVKQVGEALKADILLGSVV